MKLRRLLTITKKEFIHVFRDKASLRMSLFMPMMMLLLFGYAVNTDVNNVNLIVYDGSRTQESRELINCYDNSYYFQFSGLVDSPDDVEKYIDNDTVKVGLIIPADYAVKLHRNKAPEIQIMVDGSDPTIARTAMSYSTIIANNYSLKLKKANSGSGASAGTQLGIDARRLVLYNPTLESSKFNVPGVIGLILQNITIILTAFAMVRERERGTIEQLIMTPVTSLELILGKLIPYICIGFFNMLTVLIFSNLIFGVVVKGSVGLLILLGSLFLICALAMGMLISTAAKTQLQAMQASLIIILPSVLLSGFMFPREAMPTPIYFLGNLLPLTYFLHILRGIIVKGASSQILMSTIMSLSFLTFAIIVVTMKKFRKTLD